MEIKNLYDRDDYEKYKEIINMITDLYLDSLVRITYPQFSQSLIHISVSRNEPYHTYLEVISVLLSTYIHLKNMYDDADFEKKYLECNPNNGEDIVE